MVAFPINPKEGISFMYRICVTINNDLCETYTYRHRLTWLIKLRQAYRAARDSGLEVTGTPLAGFSCGIESVNGYDPDNPRSSKTIRSSQLPSLSPDLRRPR